MGVTHMYHKCLIKVLLLFIKGFFSVFFRLSVFRTVEFFFPVVGLVLLLFCFFNCFFSTPNDKCSYFERSIPCTQ